MPTLRPSGAARARRAVTPVRLARMGVSVLAGLALWLAFPSHNLWWMAPVGVALFAPAVAGVRLRSGFILGFVLGMAFFLPTLSWSGIYVGAVPWIALAVLESLYFAVMGLALAAVQRRALAPFVGACLWVTQEWLRGMTPFGGLPWARLAFSQADAPYTPLVAWVSSPGLTFVVALLGGGMAALAQQCLSRRRGHDRPHPPAELRLRDATVASRRINSAAALVVAAVAVIIGSLIHPPVSGRSLRVAAVQGNVPTSGLDFNAQRRAVLDNHTRATVAYATQVDAGSTPKPDVVIWPENSSDIDPLRNPDAAADITRASNAVKVPLVVGAVLAQPAPKVSNASMLYLPGKGLTAMYVKQHPVPFGEYIPYRSFFRMFSKKVDLVRADFVQGNKVGVFDIPTSQGTVKLAPVICFEVAYDDLLRKPANQGAQIFAVQTNNATFGHTDESVQQLAISRIRALEYGRSVIHISTVGVSALITPDGHLHDASSLFTRKVLTGELPLRSHATLAQRVGRAPEIAATTIAVLALAATRRRRKSSRPSVR